MNEYMHYKVLEDKLNIRLLEQILRFAYETSANDVKNEVYSICNKSLFTYSDEDDGTIQSEYDFRYFGELLERHSQKISDNIENIRALAIGFAMLEQVLPDDMYVANQKKDFIKELELYSDDLLVKLSLYRVKNPDALLGYDFNNTEEVLLAIMLAPEFETAIDMYKEKLIFFLGKGRTISAEDNGALFSWFAGRIKGEGITFKKKADELLKVLSNVGFKNIKPESKEYEVLLKYGYIEEEIRYLLYYAVVHGHQCGKIEEESIVGEKIAIGFVTCFLNSEKQHSEYTYDMISYAYVKHKVFRIKCNGYDSLYLATVGEVKIVCPYTLSKVWGIFKNDCAKWIDYFDDKWNSLYKYLDTKAYNTFFVDMLKEKKLSKTVLKRYITRYHKVTGKRLKELFSDKVEFNHDTIRLIKILMQHGLFDVWDYSERTENQENRNDLLEHTVLSRYMSETSFDFWSKYFNKYSMEYAIDEFEKQLSDIFMCSLNNGWIAYNAKEFVFNFNKLNISEEHQKKYLEWMEEYFYLEKHNQYIDFVVSMISDENAKKLIEFNKRKEIYDALKEIRPEITKDSAMQKEYLTAKELQEIERIKKRKEYEEKYLKELNKKQNFEDNFCKLYQGDYTSLYEFIEHNSWEKHKDMYKKVINVFKALCRKKNCAEEGEFKAFLSVCQYLAEKEEFSYTELKKLITEME